MTERGVPDPRIVWPCGHEPASAIVFVQNVIETRASAEKVWSLLVDCTAWPGYYEHCSDVSMLRGGPRLSAGSKFRFKTLGFFFEPEIETFEPPHLLVWSARGPLVTSGAHAWHLETTADGCRIITEETQRGFALRPLRTRTRSRLFAAHEAWLQSLKTLAEDPSPDRDLAIEQHSP